MATIINCFEIEGIDAFHIEIEVSTIKGIPSMNIIGMGDQAITEAGDRVRAAIYHCGFCFPAAKLIISLAPGDKRKRGSHYDLGIAIGIIKQSGQLLCSNLNQYAFIGELSLNGILRPVSGILPMIIEAKRIGITNIILPVENVAEARLITGVNILGFNNLNDITEYLDGNKAYTEPQIPSTIEDKLVSSMDFSEVKGQDDLISAIVLAVAGSHNLLMLGEPGCGKTMISERIPTIMPTMTEEEALDVTKIHSVAGLIPGSHSLVTKRPFRSPHHNASLNALIGGGNPAQPGEVSLSHNGVLFLDELPEFPRSVLESLRQPMENRSVTISRVNGTNTYPANFMLVAAMNPCPCGYYPSKRCRCSDYEIKHYRSKLSGPILERIDIQKEVKPVDYFSLTSQHSGYTSTELREHVEKAREIQKIRYKDYKDIHCNAQMTSSMIQEYCTIDTETEDILREASQANYYSARVINKLLKLARTSADLGGAEKIRKKDIEIVLSCRDLDSSSNQMYTV